MTYLIAHKVRGQPAFDVAIRMQCPMCNGDGCHKCDDLGYWWIIPTSGHRAYPYWNVALVDLYTLEGMNEPEPIDWVIGRMPEHWPDHYLINTAPAFDLATALGFREAKPAKPFPRRI